MANWFIKACQFCNVTEASAAFVATNSICQGEQVALLWPIVFNEGMRVSFAHTSFQWSNLASDKAGVTVVIVGISRNAGDALLVTNDEARRVTAIGPYLVPNSLVFVEKRSTPISELDEMYLGNMAKDGGNLIMSAEEGRSLADAIGGPTNFIRKFFGSEELIHSKPRACLWIEDELREEALDYPEVEARVDEVRRFRIESKAPSTRRHAETPHRFVQISAKTGQKAIIIPRVSSENRPYLPVDYFRSAPVIGDKCYAIYDAGLENFALLVSKMHIVWIGTVCSRLRTDFSYGNKLGWNTFPVPKLTENNRLNLIHCAEDILLAREAHFPATIADLYDPERMPEDLRAAHDRNDEVLERIIIGRRFKNDTERLEKLLELYTKMTEEETKKPAKSRKKA